MTLTDAQKLALLSAARNSVDQVIADLQGPPPAPAPTPTAVLPRHGISTGFKILTRSDADIAFELDRCQAVGAKYVRIDLLDAPNYQTAFGKILAGAEARGLKMLGVLHGTTGSGLTPAQAASFATRMATAWGSRIAYEFLNEPNLPHSAPRWTGAAYATALRASHDALKAVQPSALFVAGALGFEVAGDFSNFVAAMGTGWTADLFSIHCYGAPSRANWTEGFALSVGRPIIVTEAGQSAAGGEAGQATVVAAALTDARPASLAVFCMMDDVLTGYGLLRPDRSERPAFAAYKAAA